MIHLNALYRQPFAAVSIGTLLLILCSFAQPVCAKATFNVADFGAKGDGTTLNTQSIQQTIDACAQSGGGTVVVPKGRFLTGTIHLKSGVELRITEGGVLLGSTNFTDYARNDWWYALILAKGQKGIRITGKGTIDGQGRALAADVVQRWRAGAFPDEKPWDPSRKELNRPSERHRPQLIEFWTCQNVLIEGVTLKNAACWVQTYSKCTDLTIQKIRVESTAYWNNDGIDVMDCHRVRILNCFVNAADDAICLKSIDPARGCDGVFIKNCTLRSSANALKFGTASEGPFRNVTVRNLTVFDTYRSAIALESVDGGTLENVDIQNVKARNTGNAIFIRLGHRYAGTGRSRVNNVRIRRLKCTVPAEKPDKGYEMEGPPDDQEAYNPLPSSIVGLPNQPVTNVRLERVTIVYNGVASRQKAFVPLDSLEKVPERPEKYPEFSMFGELPAWGFYVRHTEGVTFDRVRIEHKGRDFRPAIVADDTERLSFLKMTVVKGGGEPIVALKNARNAHFHRVQYPKNAVSTMRSY